MAVIGGVNCNIDDLSKLVRFLVEDYHKQVCVLLPMGIALWKILSSSHEFPCITDISPFYEQKWCEKVWKIEEMSLKVIKFRTYYAESLICAKNIAFVIP